MRSFYKIGFFILLSVIFISASSVVTYQLVESKPAKPKSVVAFLEYSEGASSKILKYTENGYIIKSISGASTGSTGPRKQLVVMEKY